MSDEDLKEQANYLHKAYLKNLALKIKEGKSLNDKDFKRLQQFIQGEDTQQSKASEGDPGIPEKLKIKRHYTMSEKAREQRRKAGKGSKVNAWKHGKTAKSFLHRLKPCYKTCQHYPCEVVVQGGTKPGGVCLDKAAVISNYQTIIKAIEKKEYGDFNELAALTIAESIHVLHLLMEDIQRDGTILKRYKYDKDGKEVGYEVVTHPSLLALPKMIADLGLTPNEMMITPKALLKKDEDDEGIKSIADLMSTIGKKIQVKHEKEDED